MASSGWAAARSRISPDYLEIGSFLGLGAVTRGEIRIQGVASAHMRMINMVFGDRLGVRMHMAGDVLVVADDQDLSSVTISAAPCPRWMMVPGRISRLT